MAEEDFAELRRPGEVAGSAWEHVDVQTDCSRLWVALNALSRLADRSMQRYAHPPQQPNLACAHKAFDGEPSAGEGDQHAARLEQAAFVRMGEQSLLRHMKGMALECLLEQQCATDSGHEYDSQEPGSDEESVSGCCNASGGESDESEGEAQEALALGLAPGGGEVAQQRAAGSQLAGEVHASPVQPCAGDCAPVEQARKKPKL